jgi:Sec-independent protein translocase protein TatA
MITGALFLLFLGLIVFGPKRTIEITQTVGRVLAQV